jgi:hypothetical protein
MGLGRRPQVLMAVADYEVALLASARVDGRLEALAGVKAAALIKLRVLPRYRVGVGPSRRLDGRSLQTLSRVPRCATRYQALSRANAGLVRLMAPRWAGDAEGRLTTFSCLERHVLTEHP